MPCKRMGMMQQLTAGPRSIRVRGKTTMMFVSQVQSLISCKRGRNGVQFENHLDQLLLPRTFLDLHSHLVEWSMACQGQGIPHHRLAICGRKLRNLYVWRHRLAGHPCRCRLHTILRSRQGDPCPSCPSPPPSLDNHAARTPRCAAAAHRHHASLCRLPPEVYIERGAAASDPKLAGREATAKTFS